MTFKSNTMIIISNVNRINNEVKKDLRIKEKFQLYGICQIH